MASSAITAGALVTLRELNSSSPYFKQGASLRVTGKWVALWGPDNFSGPHSATQERDRVCLLQEYSVETALAVLVDGGATLKIDIQHLSLNLRVGSVYQFIGELYIQPNSEAVLKARVGRNVDGIDLNLYHQSLQLLREFQADQINSRTP